MAPTSVGPWSARNQDILYTGARKKQKTKKKRLLRTFNIVCASTSLSTESVNPNHDVFFSSESREAEATSKSQRLIHSVDPRVSASLN